MNILFLSELFYPQGGGAEYATYLYAKRLSQVGFNITVITNKSYGEPEIFKHGKLKICRLPLLSESGSVKYAILKRFDALFSSFMRKMMKWADVIYIPRFWFSAIPLAKVLEKPIIIHLHDYIPICSLAVLYNEAEGKICNGKGFFCLSKCIYAYEKLHGRSLMETLWSVALNSSIGRYLPKLIELSDAVICVSEYQKRVLATKKPCLRDRLYITYNPVPNLKIVEIKGDDFGYFGGPETLKGFQVLYKALSHLNQANFNTRIHATKFPCTWREKADIFSKVGIIIHNKLNSNELRSIYQTVRAIIVPSIWPEPWPYVVVEALVQGRIVLASKVGGIPEQVQGCKGVQLFNTGDYVKLAECMEYFSSLDREEVIDLGLQNREVFLRRFNTESSIKNFINIIQNVS
ncbi:MAG: glycosyltransferase family 4 protein [Candidatus Bathyarchaeales archaeon]